MQLGSHIFIILQARFEEINSLDQKVRTPRRPSDTSNRFREGFKYLKLPNPGFLSDFNLWLSFEWLSEPSNGALTFSISLLVISLSSSKIF